MLKIGELIDEFVEALNRKPFISLLPDQVPQQLRIKELSSGGEPQWQIRHIVNSSLVGLEEVLGTHLPKGYRSLIERYQFDEFTVGPITFLPNFDDRTPRRLLSDEGMAPHLLNEGLVQFGRPAGGSYDPICFTTKQKSKADAPILRVDHEDILIRNGRIRIKEEIAPSFRNFVERVISGEFAR